MFYVNVTCTAGLIKQSLIERDHRNYSEQFQIFDAGKMTHQNIISGLTNNENN